MKKKHLVLLPVLIAALCGCGKKEKFEIPVSYETTQPVITETTEATIPATIPEDGNPGDVTCKGSYTSDVNGSVIASVAGAELTNEQLQVWYWAEAAQYRQEAHENAPDFSRPLEEQVCQIDSSVASWQQYFLREALNAWHRAQALVLQSEETPMAKEEAYQPNLQNYEIYLTNMPATQYLYGYDDYYQPNTMHQEYLDQIPEMLEELAVEKGYSGASAMAKSAFGATQQALEESARLYNLAYMYFTELSYDIEPTEEELASFYAEKESTFAADGSCVDIRHILMTPEGSDWETCESEAQKLLTKWQTTTWETESTFAEMANKNSDDEATALDGGAYSRIRKGQLIEELDAWCFDPQRKPGDSALLRSEQGMHIMFFVGSTDAGLAEAEDAYYSQKQMDLIDQACETYPMEVSYSAITLGVAEGTVAAGEILYADVAHERFPEVPLYLQQDYPRTMYGGYKITTNGCGITSFAMLASYMADDELTPPEMCDRYGRYSLYNGTDGMIFNNESPANGFYLREKTYDPNVAKAALEEGQIVISIQHKGYWTRGGHYIVLERINEDGLVQVRDSNIYNYGKLEAHLEDLHTWGSITGSGSGYWIFEDKVTSIPACIRCGTGGSSVLTEDYCCPKCRMAMLRRNTYLTVSQE